MSMITDFFTQRLCRWMDWWRVGTANMDIRSFALNFEVNATIYSERTVGRLEAAFENDITKCKAGYKESL